MPGNFILGNGEKLTERVDYPRRRTFKVHPYSFAEARKRLAPRVAATSAELQLLPALACPNNEAVAVLTLHPAYIAKSYYPEKLLEALNLTPIGSRTRAIRPEKSTRKRKPRERDITSELFVAGRRDRFVSWVAEIQSWSETLKAAEELREIEDIRSLAPDEKVRAPRSDDPEPWWEVVLHLGYDTSGNMIIETFDRYLSSIGIQVDTRRHLFAKGLVFLPLRFPRDLVLEAAKFTFCRLIREMPRLRPILRTAQAPSVFPYSLPAGGPLDKTLRIAVFDGGLPQTPDLTPWVSAHEAQALLTLSPNS